MRFGAMVPQGWRMDLVGVPVDRQWDTMLEVANEAETLGYESAWLYDHFHTVPQATQEVTWECWTVMSALAVTTSNIRLGQMCTCNSYRQPSYMAKVASCVDVLSGGRVEFAIGAGWYEHEYVGYGYEYAKPSVRIGRLGEAVQIIKAMWADEEVSFKGEHYTLDGAINQPKPVQRPIPMWIAGGGEKLTLRLVAEEADYANFSGDLDLFRHKRKVLEGHCEAVGRDPADIGLTLHLECVIGAAAKDVRRKAEEVGKRRGQDPDKILEYSISGTPDEVTEQLASYAGADCSYFIGYFPDAAWDDGLEVFAREVMPQLAG